MGGAAVCYMHLQEQVNLNLKSLIPTAQREGPTESRERTAKGEGAGGGGVRGVPGSSWQRKTPSRQSLCC
jgi:hypothetical protein